MPTWCEKLIHVFRASLLYVLGVKSTGFIQLHSRTRATRVIAAIQKDITFPRTTMIINVDSQHVQVRTENAPRETGEAGLANMLQFGVFDHLDHNGASLGEQLEDRLKLIGVLEAEGYYAYHVAEHHSTRLGMAPSPSVFLAAVAQRTRRIRFGPLVYVLPLHHPLRLYEEICMLDHLSGGRLQLGVGRGGALLEHQRYGIDPATAQAMYHEAFAVLMQACETEVLNFDGRFYHFKDYLAVAKPLQRPHPPLWYGAPNADAVPWAVTRGVNVISLGPAVARP